MGKVGSIGGLSAPPPVIAQERETIMLCSGFDLFVCPDKHLHMLTTAGGKRITEHVMEVEDGYSLARAIESACDEIIGA